MKKINSIIITSNIDFINSINSVLKDFDDITVCNVVLNMEALLNLEKTKDFDIAFWDMDVEGVSLKEQFTLLKKDLKIIILSSNPKDAIDAFNIGAVDFLLKSDGLERLPKSIKKARYLIEINDKITNSNPSIVSTDPIKIIAVSSLNDITIIPVDSITYLESKGRYTLIYTQDGQTVVSSKNLGLYEDLLMKNNFFRIHHSFIVNVDLSVKIQKKDGIYLEIINKKYLPISKRRVEGFYRHLGIIT
jgi:two-component system, LytTR family, response regulator